jgi:hypothetical protein
MSDQEKPKIVRMVREDGENLIGLNRAILPAACKPMGTFPQASAAQSPPPPPPQQQPQAKK